MWVPIYHSGSVRGPGEKYTSVRAMDLSLVLYCDNLTSTCMYAESVNTILVRQISLLLYKARRSCCVECTIVHAWIEGGGVTREEAVGRGNVVVQQ